jgi:lipopolysaccharide transport system permease protein
MDTQKLTEIDDTLIIEAGRAELHYWRDLWRYRELLGFLAWRDVKVRYKQAVIGMAWVIIQPVIQTVLLTLVFSKLAKMPDGGLPYPLIVIAGLLPWQLFSTAFSGAGNSLVGNANLISKVYFPRLIVPLSSLAVALVDMLILLVVALLASIYFDIYPTWRILLLPLFIAYTLLIASGAGFWITALTVKYRDFRFITPFILQIGIFVTPVGFRTDVFPYWRELLSLNPLTFAVEGFRWCLLSGKTEFYAHGLVISFSITLILLLSGIRYFRNTERKFADII